MQKLANQHALSFIDSFLTKVKEEKVAEESPITEPSKIGGQAAGTVTAKVGDKVDNSPEKTKEEEKAKEGTFAKEKHGDLSAATTATGVEQSAAKNNQSKDNERAATGDIGGGPIESHETPSHVSAEKLKVAAEQKIASELKRAQSLGNAILQKLAAKAEMAKKAAEAEVPEVHEETASKAEEKADEAANQPKEGGSPEEGAPEEKTASIQKLSEEEMVEAFLKEAADAAYHDFVTSYQYGLLKRAEDEAAIQSALNVTAEEASQLLDEIAAENPEAVLPAEEQAGAEGEMIPAEEIPQEPVEGELPPEAVEEVPAEAGVAEEAAPVAEGGIDEEALLDALVEAGVTPEDLEQAAMEVQAEEAQLPFNKGAAFNQSLIQGKWMNVPRAAEKAAPKAKAAAKPASKGAGKPASKPSASKEKAPPKTNPEQAKLKEEVKAAPAAEPKAPPAEPAAPPAPAPEAAKPPVAEAPAPAPATPPVAAEAAAVPPVAKPDEWADFMDYLKWKKTGLPNRAISAGMYGVPAAALGYGAYELTKPEEKAAALKNEILKDLIRSMRKA